MRAELTGAIDAQRGAPRRVRPRPSSVPDDARHEVPARMSCWASSASSTRPSCSAAAAPQVAQEAARAQG